jgi:hypothetical protein
MQDLKSGYGTKQLDIGLSNSNLVSWSTTELPWIPISDIVLVIEDLHIVIYKK